MNFGSLLLLSLGLAMDATAVSAARGLALTAIRPRHVVSVAAFFGGFQALMPLAGWLMGTELGPWVNAWSRWIASGLLFGIGAKMLWEVRGAPETPAGGASYLRDKQLFRLDVLLVLAIATSIDAFAAGVALPLLGAPLALSLFTIGLTTALTSALGLFAGRKFGALLGKRLDVVGSLILIALGIKILAEHLTPL